MKARRVTNPDVAHVLREMALFLDIEAVPFKPRAYEKAAHVVESLDRSIAEIFAAAIALGGTLSGEHGVGLLKRPFLADDIGTVAIDVMRGIKSALDPLGILNPGKIFP